jgi:hypothetical protein
MPCLGQRAIELDLGFHVRIVTVEFAMSPTGIDLARRGFLRVGTLAMCGLSLGDLMRGRAAASGSTHAASFGRAKSCIFVFLKGGPPQLDTFDMKPNAPVEIRGEFRPISTRVPGVRISEHLPLLAQQADKFAVLRTLSHHDGTHSTAAFSITTGRPFPRPGEAVMSRDDPPHFGSLVAAFGDHNRPAPPFVMAPDYLVVNGEFRGGQNAGFMGSQFDPLAPGGDPSAADFRPADLNLAARVAPTRLASRAQLLAALSRQLTGEAEGMQVSAYNEQRRRALALVSAEATQQAFDLEREPANVRERYGRTRFGQSVLLARRLVEARVQLVHINCMSSVLDPERNWDLHKHNFQTLRDVLLPRTDPAVATLLTELAERGLLETTLVVMLGEFGRTPKINANAGRDHWPAAQSVLLAGAGIPGGLTYGATDENGAEVIDRPVQPAQFVATILHALGVDPELEIRSREGRPYRICEAQPVLGLWG